MESSENGLWVGITDRETEGIFKYLNGQTVNGRVNQGETLLYYFKGSEPNNYNGDEDCVIFNYYGELNDISCSTVTTAFGVDLHGLCEIKYLLF